MALHESAEMYLETIYQLTKVKSGVRSIDIAEAMGYSKPSISRAVGLLKQGGYLSVDESGFLTLTESGRETAERVFERHMILTKALEALGVSAETAAEDACKVEHILSDETFHAIKKHLEQFAQ
jgi:Mn-dependent DtxR family transcriptional regulator